MTNLQKMEPNTTIHTGKISRKLKLTCKLTVKIKNPY